EAGHHPRLPPAQRVATRAVATDHQFQRSACGSRRHQTRDVVVTVLDDFDSRSGSATSLLRTIIGAHLRSIGGAATVADLITLMGAVGVSAASTRSAVLRVKLKGLIEAETVRGQPGYRLNPDAVPMLERGDRRIYSFRQQGDDDSWCLISY